MKTTFTLLPSKKKLAITIIAVFCTITAFSQQRNIQGEILSADGQPLVGATVRVKGTEKGTVTGAGGHFELPVPENAVLQVSSIGYQPKEVPVGTETNLQITLQQSAKSLNQVVVTALGIERNSKTLPYATQTVKPRTLTEIRAPNNFLNSFQGKIANALITQASGGVGSSARVVLRGNRSIDGNSSALIVVDGVPINDPSTINPDDIASVTVLRGASGAALYGSQAGNGVIVITTKKGQTGQATVRINSGLVVESPFVLPDVQDIYGQGSNGELDASADASWGAKMTGQDYTNYLGEESTYSPHPDNIKNFFRNGVNRNNSVTVSGGSEKMQGYLSYTHNDVKGIIPKNDLTSHNVNLRVTSQISKKLSADAKITYFNQEIKHIPRASEGNKPILDIYNIQRNISLETAKQYQEINELGIPELVPWPSSFPYNNPYWVVNYDIHNKTTDQVLGFIHLKYQITDWLSVTGRANLDRTFDNEEQKIYQGTAQWATRPGGYYSRINSTTTEKWFDLIFEGNNKLTPDLSIHYHAGAIYKDNRFDQTNTIANGLNVANKFSLNFATDPTTSSDGTEVQTQSVFGQVNLAYKDAVYLDASLRNDWDSRLPAPHSYAYYSAGISGILSEMFTLPELLSFLKASFNYAEVGNGGQFGLLFTTYQYEQGAGHGYLSRSPVLSIPNLKPEIVRNVEASIEAGFLENRLNFSVTYYKSNSFNQLLTISLPAPTGYSSQYINAGNIENKGVEVVLNAVPVNGTDFNWNIDFNLGINRNKVLALSDNLKIVYFRSYLDFGGRGQAEVGGRYGDIFGYGWARNEDGKFIVTADGKPLTDMAAGNQPRYLGNFNPKASLGLSNTFTYKGISLRVLMDGRVGGVIVNGTEQNLSFSGLTQGTVAHREGGWDLGGVDVDGRPVSATISAQDFWQTVSGKRFGNGEFYTYDATNFRIRELSLGYSLPLPDNFFLKSASLSVVARNLLWLYRGYSTLDIPGLEQRKMSFDPDMSFTGVVYGQFPSTRSVGFNLNLTF